MRSAEVRERISIGIKKHHETLTTEQRNSIYGGANKGKKKEKSWLDRQYKERQDYDRNYYKKNKDKRESQIKDYYKNNRQKIYNRMKKNKEDYPEKDKARLMVQKAVKSGELKREPCLFCGNEKVHGHHQDYSKPLFVIWLCPKCHKTYHALSEQQLDKQKEEFINYERCLGCGKLGEEDEYSLSRICLDCTEKL